MPALPGPAAAPWSGCPGPALDAAAQCAGKCPLAFLRAGGRGVTGENVTQLLSAAGFFGCWCGGFLVVFFLVCLNRKFFPFLKGGGKQKHVFWPL